MPTEAIFIGFFLFYLFTLFLEVIRFFRKRWIGENLPFGLVSFGAVVQFVFLMLGFFGQDERLFPGIGVWFFLLSWTLVLFLVYYYIYYHSKNFCLFILPFVLIMIIVAYYLDNFNFSVATTSIFVRSFHGLAFLFASLFVLTGFITGCMYFLQYRQLVHGGVSGFFSRLSLPSLEWLIAANRRSVKLSLVCLALGIFSGFWLDYAAILPAFGTNAAIRQPFMDPMVLGAVFLFLVLLCFLLVQTLTPYWQSGTTVAVLTIACFLFLVVVLSIGVGRNTHWIRETSQQNITEQNITEQNITGTQETGPDSGKEATP